MSKNKGKEVTKTEEKKDYPIYETKEKGSIVIPADVLAQITFLHASFGATEWSGILLYDTVKGSPTDPKNFKVEAKGIFLMDIGSAAYTEYETDESIIDIYDQYEDAMNWKMGHIHTHHSMKAYFSGTDEQELKDNVDKHNYYLSLIVNFDGDYTAKVAFLSEVDIQSKMNFTDDHGKKVGFTLKEKEHKMVTIDMKIFYGVDDFISKRTSAVIKKVKEEKEKKEAALKSKYRGYKGGEYYDPLADNGIYGTRNLIPFKEKIDKPTDINHGQVEKLTRNILAGNSDLTEIKAVYTIISSVAENDDGTLDVYYKFIADNLDAVIEEFFDGPLATDELFEVLAKVEKSIARFELNPKLTSVCEELCKVISNRVLMEQLIDEEEELEQQFENKLADERA